MSKPEPRASRPPPKKNAEGSLIFLSGLKALRRLQVLRALMNAAAPGAVLLLEDVDAAFTKREAADSARHLTFSGAALL